MTDSFVEVADRVFVLRHPVFDVNVTLVAGDRATLLIDTLSTAKQAAALAVAARAISPHPFVIVNTHHHFDHWLGNATLAGDPPGQIWAHEETAALLRERPEEIRRQAYDELLTAEPELAVELASTPLLPPTHTVGQEGSLDLGGRLVTLRHPGRGHTAGDLIVQVPDADVLVAGDLLEESGPPSFEDSYPIEWPETIDELVQRASPRTVIIPGHGAVLDVDGARAQHAELAALAWLIRDGHADDAPVDRVAARSPYGPRVARVAVRRGYAELAGDA